VEVISPDASEQTASPRESKGDRYEATKEGFGSQPITSPEYLEEVPKFNETEIYFW
jgi:hypothetical protein